MAGTDVALVTLKPSETFKTVLPSKMFEAMAARKPIVLAVEGEAKRVLQHARGGLCVAPGDAHALAAAIDRLAGDPDLRMQLGTCGAEYVGARIQSSRVGHPVSRDSWHRFDKAGHGLEVLAR